MIESIEEIKEKYKDKFVLVADLQYGERNKIIAGRVICAKDSKSEVQEVARVDNSSTSYYFMVPESKLPQMINFGLFY